VDIVDRLRRDHEEIQTAFADMLNSDIDDVESYGRKFIDLMIQLEGHERAEEQTIYAQLQTDLDIRPIALQAMEEHRISRMLMRDLSDVKIIEEVWLPKLVVVNNIVSLHIQIEEGNVIPLLEHLFDNSAREKLDRDFDLIQKSTAHKLRT